ncbi:hypothetical protein FOMPIDRAFT_94505 [Fomitopsis schrenkii]|uniref:Uncharacterized protein n=1 Tax=Fomitopsis schrenkii TaxID=2126942 RepID=S8DIL6_FOMSC|nr:hypothetical protein FOMPIDRAFT_94505 [Fomitopsis schrenkii]
MHGLTIDEPPSSHQPSYSSSIPPSATLAPHPNRAPASPPGISHTLFHSPSLPSSTPWSSTRHLPPHCPCRPPRRHPPLARSGAPTAARRAARVELEQPTGTFPWPLPKEYMTLKTSTQPRRAPLRRARMGIGALWGFVTAHAHAHVTLLAAVDDHSSADLPTHDGDVESTTAT